MPRGLEDSGRFLARVPRGLGLTTQQNKLKLSQVSVHNYILVLIKYDAITDILQKVYRYIVAINILYFVMAPNLAPNLAPQLAPKLIVSHWPERSNKVHLSKNIIIINPQTLPSSQKQTQEKKKTVKFTSKIFIFFTIRITKLRPIYNIAYTFQLTPIYFNIYWKALSQVSKYNYVHYTSIFCDILFKIVTHDEHFKMHLNAAVILNTSQKYNHFI